MFKYAERVTIFLACPAVCLLFGFSLTIISSSERIYYFWDMQQIVIDIS